MKSKSFFLARLIPLVFLLAFTSENQFHKQIQEKLNAYYDRNMPVKLSFFFNQPQYVPGDTIFFRTVMTKAADYMPVPGRQIVNVDLTDHKGATILQQKILLENGWGRNQIVIPRDLSPGAYTLVGYSNWMKNHDHRLFSYNRLMITGLTQLTLDEKQSLHFFPEGGVLTKGVNNKVVVTGNPEENVTIIDKQDRPVSSIVLDKFGVGIFFLTPSANDTYKGVSDKRQVDLPPTTNNPVSMIITPSLSESPLKIALEKSDAFADGEPLYVMITNQRKVYYSEKVSFGDKNNTVINIPYDELLPGLSLITLFREDGTELLNRIIFIRNFHPASVRIEANKKTLVPREKVEISLQLMNDKGEPMIGNVSVSVQDSALLPPKNNNSITQNLAFSDLPYSVLTHPAIGEMDDNTLNDFLITQEWRRFAWKDVMVDKAFDRYPMSSYLRLAGKAIHPDGKSFGDSTQITFFLQQDANTFQTYIDSTGNFNFPSAVDFESTDVYYRVETKGNRQKGVLIQPQTNDHYPFVLPAAKELSEPSALGLFTENRFLIDNAYKRTLDLKNYTQRSKETFDNSLSEYFVADVEVKLSDYLLMPTMEETFREILPALAHRMVGKRSTIRMHLPDEKRWSAENPLFIIDGIITDDMDYLMSLKPKDVNVIKIINSHKNKAVLGAIARNGVLIIETNIPGHARKVPRASERFYAIGISRAVPFSNVTDKSFHPRVPILKSCLYWNPDLRTDASGKAKFSFYAADNAGTFRIVIDGVTDTGEPVSKVQYITVKMPVH